MLHVRVLLARRLKVGMDQSAHLIQHLFKEKLRIFSIESDKSTVIQVGGCRHCFQVSNRQAPFLLHVKFLISLLLRGGKFLLCST